MTDTAELGSKGDETTSEETVSNESGETKNTSKDDSLFNSGYGKGVATGKKELLSDLGVEDLDSLKEVLKFKAEFDASQQTAGEQLTTVKDELKALKKEVKGYREKDDAEATVLFDSLSETHQAAVKATGLNPSQLIPMMRTLTSKKTESVGTPFSPQTNDEQTTSSKSTRRGLDPDYLKDKQAYIDRKRQEIERRQANS